MIVRQLVASYVLLVAVAIGAFTIPVAFILSAQLHADTEDTVRREADVASRLLSLDDVAHREALASLVDAFERETPGRMDVLLAGGRAAAPRPLPAAPDDPAFATALAGRDWPRWGRAWVRDADGLVVAIPARDRLGQVVGAVRVSFPAAPINHRSSQIWLYRAGLAAAVLVVAGVLGLLLARRLTMPLRQLTTMATVLRDGDLSARAVETGPAEIRTLARTLNTATEVIDGLVRSQRVFIADASHQLRTPLTALRLSLDNIADDVEDPSTQEDIDRAAAEVIRMTNLVNGLLALAKAEADGAAKRPTTDRVRVDQVVTERFDAWRSVAEEKGAGLRLESAAPTYAQLIPGHLEQILDNALSNALDFSPPGGTVTVMVRTDERTVTITITDDGPGIASADRERAFDRFWRGGNPSGRTGSGLGLAILRQLVIDNRGTVTLAQAPSAGLAVHITLPSV